MQGNRVKRSMSLTDNLIRKRKSSLSISNVVKDGPGQQYNRKEIILQEIRANKEYLKYILDTTKSTPNSVNTKAKRLIIWNKIAINSLKIHKKFFMKEGDSLNSE